MLTKNCLLSDRSYTQFYEKKNQLHLYGFIHPDTLIILKKRDMNNRSRKIKARLLTNRIQYSNLG